MNEDKMGSEEYPENTSLEKYLEDISKRRALETIDATEPDLMEFLADPDKYTKLVDLGVAGCNLPYSYTPLDSDEELFLSVTILDVIERLGCVLKNNQTTLTEIKFYEDGWEEAAAKILAEGLKNNQTVTKLSFEYSCMHDSSIEMLIDGLQSNQTLTELKFKNIEIELAAAQSLAKMLEVNRTLTKLNLRCDTILGKGVKAIAKALEDNQTLNELDLSGNLLKRLCGNNIVLQNENKTLNSVANVALAEMLKINQTLTTLKLSDNAMGEGEMKSVIEALKDNQTLTKLDLSSNYSSNDAETVIMAADELGVAISKMLRVNQALLDLNLDECYIGNTGIIAIAQELKSNQILVKLHLKNNDIGSAAVLALAEMLKVNQVLASLNLSDKYIGDTEVITLTKALESNYALRELDLESKHIGEVGGKALAEMLENNNTLAVLNLCDSKKINRTILTTIEEKLAENKQRPQPYIRKKSAKSTMDHETNLPADPPESKIEEVESATNNILSLVGKRRAPEALSIVASSKDIKLDDLPIKKKSKINDALSKTEIITFENNDISPQTTSTLQQHTEDLLISSIDNTVDCTLQGTYEQNEDTEL